MSSRPKPAEPAIAMPLKRSAACTFSTARWAIEDPAVARRSPAITTPSTYRTATMVVAWMSTNLVSPATVAPRGLGASPAEQGDEPRPGTVVGGKDRQAHEEGDATAPRRRADSKRHSPVSRDAP